ncbi:VOC family protein [Streptomyces verrucosisporus]|uniref:VOC family protein n=1 Tax=Streptomyces verrucosisporus TaxID=1695161 RepID=UPI0019CF709F|nr:VOC family protein [Streptomyces verrucosisporus]MBN3933165.1 VOC family protein [Streptomyces verrucosisporus]
MIKGLAAATVWSTDQERDLRFFTEKLGFEVRGDVTEDGTRRITVGARDQPDVGLTLVPAYGPGIDPESARALAGLVRRGVLGVGVLRTDDCRSAYEWLVERGVEFLQAPSEGPHRTEAVFRDESGNRYSLTEERASGPVPSREWSEVCD